MAVTRTDILTAVYVLRALEYAVTPADAPDATVRPNVATALRAFQAAANRENVRDLKVDGVLGPDTLNALAFYATRSFYTVPRLSWTGFTAEQQRDIQRVIDARRNNPWGMSEGGNNGGGNNGGGNGGSNGGGGSSTSRQTASTTGSSLTTFLVTATALGVAAFGASKLWKRYEVRRATEGRLPFTVQRRAPGEVGSEPGEEAPPKSRARVTAEGAARKASGAMSSKLNKFIVKGSRS